MEQRRRSWIPKFSTNGGPSSPTSPTSSSSPTQPSPGQSNTNTSESGPASHAGEPLELGFNGQAHKRTGSFSSKMAFAQMMSSLSLTRTHTNDKDKDRERERGRSLSQHKQKRSSSHAPEESERRDRSSSRARSQSPFSLRRFRTRDREPSPTPEPIRLSQSETDLSSDSESIRPRTAFTEDPESDYETEGEDDDYDDSELDDIFDPITERNTERNAVTEPVTGVDAANEAELEHDPLGEGVNVVVPPEPYFPTTLNSSAAARKRNPKRKKTLRSEQLPLETSRPDFKRDRCTLTLIQGDPTSSSRARKRYVVASDMSEESRYAVEWGIGTVLRDGDEMVIVHISEGENKIDPLIPNASDRTQKLRSQQERQALAYILVRQATQLLQRTRLNVSISCQAWHAKNARHMLLDIVDYYDPTMLIVGSRGLGQLQGILLGSTSHYLIQKCSVPVMVARRRLRRPPKKNAHLSKNRVHVKLAEAGIDRVAGKVDQDVKDMRDQIEQDDHRRTDGHTDEEREALQIEEESSGDEAASDGVKVAG